MESHEKGLITKKHIVTHAHLQFVFKRPLHFRTFAMKVFNSNTKHNCKRNAMNQSTRPYTGKVEVKHNIN